jgi:hypothetical protein
MPDMLGWAIIAFQLTNIFAQKQAVEVQQNLS